MKVRYDGPEGQVSHEVGRAIDGNAVLEPGKVYELPAELARGLARSSGHWSYVKDLDKLSQEQLRDLARDEGLEGFSTMKKPELVAWFRGEEVEQATEGASS